jgi:hypothetical protein
VFSDHFGIQWWQLPMPIHNLPLVLVIRDVHMTPWVEVARAGARPSELLPVMTGSRAPLNALERIPTSSDTACLRLTSRESRSPRQLPRRAREFAKGERYAEARTRSYPKPTAMVVKYYRRGLTADSRSPTWQLEPTR